MSDKYAIEGTENLASGTASAILQITNVTTKRAFLYDLAIGAEGTMADEVGTYDVSRFTVAPTDTTVTPRALDPDVGVASLHTDCGENGGTTGTITVNTEMLSIGIHFRAAFRWVAIPGGELIAGATASNGIVVRASAPSTTPLTHATIHFWE